MNIDDILGPTEKKKKYRKLRRLIKKPHPISGYKNIDFLKFLPQLSWWKHYNPEEQELIFKWLADDPDVPFLENYRDLYSQVQEMYSDIIPWNIWEDGESEDWIKEKIWDELEDEWKQKNEN